MPPDPHATAETSTTEKVKTIEVSVQRKVTYVFDLSATSTNLRLPYAVSAGGAVVKHAEKPGRAAHKVPFSVMVEPGSKVSLYLNTDAHPSYRKNPVYEVTPQERDIHVTITEKTGLNITSDTPVFKKTTAGKGKSIDHYTALLTGDIWLKISHAYTEKEAEAFLPKDIDAGIRKAVLSIYQGLPNNSVTAICAPQGQSVQMKQFERIPKPPDQFGHAAFGAQILADRLFEQMGRTITISFKESDNASDNITKFSLLADVLTRVHPKGYIALFEAALLANISKLTVSSAWRPMLGSIAHRAGLGVDVSYLENSSNVGVKANRSARAKEPSQLRSFRENLQSSALVKQLFSPWYMDSNTGDKKPATRNRLVTDNEKLHDDHLHITISEPTIL